MLDRFLNIVYAQDLERAVKSFASRYGIAGLCQHGLPSGHSSTCKQSADHVKGYKEFADCLDHLLNLGMELSEGRCGRTIDWAAADSTLCGRDFAPHPREFWEDVQKHVGFRQSQFQILMRRLVLVSGLYPRFCWRRGAWTIEFDSVEGSNIAAILTTQLMARIAGGLMRKCRNCPRWFQPQGRQVYCRDCGKRASWRDSKRRLRAR